MVRPTKRVSLWNSKKQCNSQRHYNTHPLRTMKSRFVFALFFVSLILPSALILANAEAPSSQRIQRTFHSNNAKVPSPLPENAQLFGCSMVDYGMVLGVAATTRGEVVFNEQVTVSDNTPFLMCGITLRLANASMENVRVFVRPANKNNTMPEATWIALAFDDHGDDGDRANDATGNIVLHTHPALLPAKTQYIEVKTELRRTTLRRSPVLQEYQCFIHSPGHTPESVQTSLQTAPQGNISAESVAMQTSKSGARLQGSVLARPSFATRTEWGCPWGQTSGPNTLTSTPPTHLLVHHSFSPGNDVTDWPAAVRGVWNFHVNSNGWSDIGYNWLIDPKGVIYQGRAWVDSNDNTQGAHFCGFNRQTMGVCMLGDFNSITPTDAALRSLVRLLAYRASANAINPRGLAFHESSSRNLNNISGHRDGCSTDCPGGMLYAQLPTLRNRVFALLNPPVVERPAASVINPQSAQVSAFVRPNGSATDVFVEWDAAASAAPALRNRRLVRQFTAQDTAQSVSTTLSDLNPTHSYSYRFVAQNSDTSAQTQQSVFTLMLTGATAKTMNDMGLLSITPNPILGTGQMRYTLETPAFVRIRLADVRGNIVATLFEANQQQGLHIVTFCEENIASGLYYCYFEVLNHGMPRHIVRPLMILR